MTARTSCIRISRSGSPAGRSDIPVPRLSNRINRPIGSQSAEEVRVPVVGPVKFEMGDESRDQNNVQLTAAGDLVRDMQTVADGVADRRGLTGWTPVGPGSCGLAGRLDVHVGDEPVSATVHGADQPLVAPVVTHRPTCLLDPARDSRLSHEPAAPHGIHELFLGHDALPVRQEVAQHVERLRLDRHGSAVSTQFEAGGIENEAVVEGEPHVRMVAQRTSVETNQIQSLAPAPRESERPRYVNLRAQLTAWSTANARPADHARSNAAGSSACAAVAGLCSKCGPSSGGQAAPCSVTIRSAADNSVAARS